MPPSHPAPHSLTCSLLRDPEACTQQLSITSSTRWASRMCYDDDLCVHRHAELISDTSVWFAFLKPDRENQIVVI